MKKKNRKLITAETKRKVHIKWIDIERNAQTAKKF